MLAGRMSDMAQAKRLERGLVKVRWFGVFLGVYLVAETNAAPPYSPRSAVVLGQALMGTLAIGNVIVWFATSRCRSMQSMLRIGFSAFILDAGVILALTWVFSHSPQDPTWVTLYILPLEGAIRYQLEGALAMVGVTLVNELAREAYLARLPGYGYVPSSVAFRVGIDAIGALVAGFMARSLAREAENAADKARQAEEAARREAAARKEVSAFNTAVLTGVAAEDLDESLRLMAEAIGVLGFETLSILLREGDELVVKGMYGMPFYEKRVPIGQGVTGAVAQTGRPLVVPDVSGFPGYIMADPTIRSEMAAPMRIGDELIGVLDVESRAVDAFDEAALGVLTRLADQIALVAHSNRLLSQQRATMRQLRELDQMKSDFVAITSHELRTPLTAIRGFVNTLMRNRDRLSDEQVSDFMRIIDRQSARLVRLVEDLLIASRIEAEAIKLSAKTLELDGFLHQAVESFDPGDRGRVRIESERRLVTLDPDRVEQVIRNLVENALKFSSPDVPVTVSARLVDGAVEIAVKDRGVGIAAEELPYIFERFHQATDVLTRENTGAGLGLFITRRLVEAMGGRIEVDSTPGAGSTFRVLIPQAAGSQPGPARDAAA